jgi:hypothetical protein
VRKFLVVVTTVLSGVFISQSNLRYFGFLQLNKKVYAASSVTYPTSDYTYPSDNGYFNVKNEPFSCYGDGRHDDTACVQEAMDAALHVRSTSGRHATVYFPAGTYLINDSLLWATYGNNNAVVTANVNTSKGCISGFRIVNGGSGYAPASSRLHGEPNPGPALYLTGGGGSGAEFYTTLGANRSVTGIQGGFGNVGSYSCAGKGSKLEGLFAI